jgi:beta-glucosidase
VGKPVVLVLLAGSALAVGWADEHVPAIVQAWYPGGRGGEAVASLLFGGFSPSGRLPVTFYRTTEELPDFHDYAMKNRTYRYMATEALYPFGYGLSYTRFEYGAIKTADRIEAGETLQCSVTVKSVGKRASEEVVQLYLKDVEASVEVPRWSLRGIRKVFLEPGEQAEVQFSLTPRQLALIDNDGRAVLEPGKFELYIGGSQPDARSEKLTGTKVQKAMFEVTGSKLELKY